MSKLFICRCIGHHLDESAEDHGIEYCNRCGQDDQQGLGMKRTFPDWIRVRLFILKWRIQNPVKTLKHWIKPCEDCGLRFNRHDYSKPHPPF